MSYARFEHEFLSQLAPVWLACRWRVMDHELEGEWPKADLAFDLLGMVDYAWEMRLLAREELQNMAREAVEVRWQAIAEA